MPSPAPPRLSGLDGVRIEGGRRVAATRSLPAQTWGSPRGGAWVVGGASLVTTPRERSAKSAQRRPAAASGFPAAPAAGKG